MAGDRAKPHHSWAYYQDWLAGVIDAYDRQEAETVPGKAIRRPMVTPIDRRIMEELHHDLLCVEINAYREALKSLAKNTTAKRPVPPGR